MSLRTGALISTNVIADTAPFGSFGRRRIGFRFSPLLSCHFHHESAFALTPVSVPN
jgi:hypothetical protein